MICSQQRCELGRRRVIEMLVDADQCGMLSAEPWSEGLVAWGGLPMS